KGASLKDPELIEIGRRVAEALPIWGPANVQCFREPDGTHPITDVNTRFGGGFPLPLAAGSGYPELALALARGESPEPRLGDVRGSSTEEFVTTDIVAPTITAPPKPKPKPHRPGVKPKPPRRTVEGIVWPTYGFDARRLRTVGSPLRPPLRKVWMFRGQSLI